MNRKLLIRFLWTTAACWVTACSGNELKDGGFTTPDSESWDGSSWSTWTATSVCGRPTWADRLNSGRGAAAYGWYNANELGFFQDVPGAAFVTYNFSIWVRKERNYNEDVTQLKIEWLDRNRNWLSESIVSNITGRSSANYALFTVTGSTTDTNCEIVRVVAWARWKTPTNTTWATLQLDDADLTAVAPTVLRIK